MKDPLLWQQFVQCFDDVIQQYVDYQNRANLVLSSVTSGCNVLVFSPVGFPMDLFIKYVATRKFGTFTKRECIFERQVVYQETPFFIEIDFGHPSNRKAIDMVQDLILTVIQSTCIHDDYHLIICKNIDYIDDPYAFRVILERFNKNAKFVCTTTSLSRLEAPIRSRFVVVRIPLFTCSQIQSIMQKIGAHYDPHLEQVHCRNIIRCIAIADLAQKGIDVSHVATYAYPLVKDFMQKETHTMTDIREFANKACAHGVPLPLLVQDLLFHIPDSNKRMFLQQASDLEHKLKTTNGGRQPLYYELLVYIAIYGKPDTTHNK